MGSRLSTCVPTTVWRRVAGHVLDLAIRHDDLAVLVADEDPSGARSTITHANPIPNAFRATTAVWPLLSGPFPNRDEVSGSPHGACISRFLPGRRGNGARPKSSEV